jgi:hypothetical protein
MMVLSSPVRDSTANLLDLPTKTIIVLPLFSAIFSVSACTNSVTLCKGVGDDSVEKVIRPIADVTEEGEDESGLAYFSQARLSAVSEAMRVCVL